MKQLWTKDREMLNEILEASKMERKLAAKASIKDQATQIVLSQEVVGEGLSKRPDLMQKMLSDFATKIYSDKNKSKNLDAPSNLTPEDIEQMKEFQLQLWQA